MTDVFNFGKIQGNGLEIRNLGSWSPNKGKRVCSLTCMIFNKLLVAPRDFTCVSPDIGIKRLTCKNKVEIFKSFSVSIRLVEQPSFGFHYPRWVIL